jgi:hypothetical protein
LSGVTGDVSTATEAAPRQASRVGTGLVVASMLGSTFGIVLSHLADHLGVGLLAEMMGGDARVFSNRVEFTGAGDLAWAGGFLFCLILGVLLLFAYPTLRGYGIPRLVFLWVLLHLLRQALTQAMLLPFDDAAPLARAYAELNPPAGLDMVIAAGGAIGLLLVALSSAAAFLAFTPHRRFVYDARRRLRLCFWIALVPAVASVFLSIPYFLPDEQSNVIPTLPLAALMFFVTLAAAPGTTTVTGPEDEVHTPWPVGFAGFMAVALSFHILVLRGGVDVDPRMWG